MVDRDVANLGADERAEIIDGIYEVAIDPERYEALLELWESKLAPLRAASNHAFTDTRLEQHAARALLFLDRYDESAARSGVQAALDEIGRTAGFGSSNGQEISHANSAATDLFNVQAGSRLRDLPIEPEDADELGKSIRAAINGTDNRPTVVRAHSTRTGGPIVFRIRCIQEVDTVLALVITSEFVWPEGLTETMREAFDLTLAEVEVVRAVTSGLAPKEIARSRGRSLDTVRTQIKSILAKTETRSQSELVRVTLGLMDVAGDTPSSSVRSQVSDHVRKIPFSSITLSDGRRYDYLEFGDPAGRPCIYFPTGYSMSRWPASAELAAERRRLRIISPIRAGYGHSSPPPADAHYSQQIASDVLELLQNLGIARTAIIAMWGDLRHAARLAMLDPDRVSGIVACAAFLPVRSAGQYDRMGKWQRFILANARYAPSLLPFLVKAAYSMARRLGKERFAKLVHARSESDLRTFEIPEVKQAILLGSDVFLSNEFRTHETFARGLVDSQTDWSDIVRACPVPVRVLYGDGDPTNPVETMRELLPLYPNLKAEFVQGAGQLLLFQDIPRVLNIVEEMIDQTPATRVPL